MKTPIIPRDAHLQDHQHRFPPRSSVSHQPQNQPHLLQHLNQHLHQLQVQQSIPENIQQQHQLQPVLGVPTTVTVGSIPAIPVAQQIQQLPQPVYTDITTLINNNPDIIPPSVESTFVDPKICQVCGKRSNDMLRHIRIHDTNPRFRCKFPSSKCNYKTINYKRRYEFKRHLLSKHFTFDDIRMDRKMTVSSVLDHVGNCACGLHTTGRLWLDNHILTEDESMSCPLFKY